MGYLFFVFYVLLFCILLTRIKFLTNSGLGRRALIILFLIKVIAGIVNSYINMYHYPVSDSVDFHEQGLKEYDLLFNNTREYLTNIFKTNYTNYSGFLEGSHSFWNDLRTNLIAKILSIFDLFSFQNFFINNLFFDFLVFFGAVYFYRVFIKAFPANKTSIIICVFLLPSVLYFTSGIHREGFIFLALSIVIYHLYYILEEKDFAWKRMVAVVFFLFFILILRNYVLFTLVPPLSAWVICSRFPSYMLGKYLAIYLVAIILFFSSSLLPSKFDLPLHVSDKQGEFIEIAKRGASAVNIKPLYPTLKSFLKIAPQALNHSMMRPYLAESNTVLYIPLALEIFACEVILALLIFFPRAGKPSAFGFFCIFFSIGMFLIIGYTIPILGAIVRYRSIYLTLLLIPILAYINWPKIQHHVYIKRNKI